LKKYSGQIIFNLMAAASGLLIFGATNILSNTPLAIVAVIVLMAILCYGNYFFVKLAGSGRKAFQPDYIINEQTFESLDDPESYIKVLKDLKDYIPCRIEAAKMIEQWELHKKKSATLTAISYSGGVYEVVDQDVESVMLSNMELFIKRTAIMQSSTGDEIGMHKNYLRELLARNDKILNDYTNLLIEASQLTGEDSGKAEVQSLDILINSIKEYRKEIESGDME